MSTAEQVPLAEAIKDLVRANRILAHENVLDAYGHVSIRHPERPDRFLISRSRSPELVEDSDIVELTLDGELVTGTTTKLYSEYYIHGAIYATRPDVNSVSHNHAAPFLPFSLSKALQLRPVLHVAAIMGGPFAFWDIADEFGSSTNLLVDDLDRGRSLARALGDSSGVVMRAHGVTIVGEDVRFAVARSVEMVKSASVQLIAERYGDIIELSQGELDTAVEFYRPLRFARPWEYWCRRAGVE